MPLLKGKFVAHVFSVPTGDEVPNPEGMAEALTERAFRTPPQAAWKTASGWVNLETWIESDFDDRDRWLMGNLAYFNYRVDEKTLPKSFKQRLAQAVKAWCKANGREKCPAGVKSELKENLEIAILPTVTPRTALVEVVWNMAEGRVYIAGKGLKLEGARKLFFNTFGMAPEIVTGLDGVSLAELNQLVDASELVPGGPLTCPERKPGNDEPASTYAEMPALPEFGGDFLLWLWHGFTEGRFSELNGERITGWVDTRVVLASGEWSATVKGGNALRDREVFIALGAGRRVRGLSLTLRIDDQEYVYDVTDALDGALSAKIPSLVKTGDVGERMLDRIHCAGCAWGYLTQLTERYARERLSSEFPATFDALTTWVTEQAHVQEA